MARILTALSAIGLRLETVSFFPVEFVHLLFYVVNNDANLWYWGCNTVKVPLFKCQNYRLYCGVCFEELGHHKVDGCIYFCEGSIRTCVEVLSINVCFSDLFGDEIYFGLKWGMVVVMLSNPRTVRRWVLKSELAVLVLRLVWKVSSLLSRCGAIRLSSWVLLSVPRWIVEEDRQV